MNASLPPLVTQDIKENFYFLLVLRDLIKRKSRYLHAKNNIILSCRVGYAGDNFVRYTGDTISMAQTQCKCLFFCGFMGFVFFVLFSKNGF